jgi:chromosome segregation ATPase
MVSTVAQGVIALLNKKDDTSTKLKIAALEEETKDLMARSAECLSERQQLRSAIEKCHEQHGDSEKDRAALRAKVDLLERFMAPAFKPKDPTPSEAPTGEHRAL